MVSQATVAELNAKAMKVHQFFQDDYNILSMNLKNIFNTDKYTARRRMGDMPDFERGMLCYCLMAREEFPAISLHKYPWAEFIAFDLGKADITIANGDPHEYRALKLMIPRGVEMGKFISARESANDILEMLSGFIDGPDQHHSMTLKHMKKDVASGSRWVTPSGGREMRF